MTKFSLIILLTAILLNSPVTDAQSNPYPYARISWLPNNGLALANQYDISIFDANFKLQKTIPVADLSDPLVYISHLQWGNSGELFTVAPGNLGGLTPEKLQIRKASDGSINAEFQDLSFHIGYTDLIGWSQTDDYMVVGSNPSFRQSEILIIRSNDGFVVNRFILERNSILSALKWQPTSEKFAAIVNKSLWLCNPVEAISTCVQADLPGVNAEFGIHFSPDGEQLALLRDSFTIDLWNVNSLSYVSSLTQHSDRIRKFVWGAHGLVVVTKDHKLTIWNPTSEQSVTTLAVEQLPISLIENSIGTKIVYQNEDLSLEVRDAETGEILARLDD